MKEKIGKIYIPGWLFVVIMAVFDELILHFWTAEAITAGRLLAVIGFALSFGGVLALVTALFPPKAQKWCAVVVTSLLAVLYLMEYFLNDAYRNFMPFETIFAGAGGIATDYFDLVMSLLARNLWRIGLMLLPVVLYGVFARCRKTGWKLRCVLALETALLYLASVGIVCLVGVDTARLTTAYNFDSAVQVFGLNMALTLDALQGSDAEEEPVFVQTTPLPTVAPTESAPPSETEDGAAEETVPPVVYEDHVLGIDFAALAQTETVAAYASLNSYVASLTPAKENEFTGLFEGKNLIFITAEAFSTPVLDPQRTPTLWRLANEGIRFTDYYQPSWGASTTSGEFSNVVGLVPTGGGACMMEAAQQDLFLTIGSQLQDLGYTSIAYHNHLHDFYSRNRTHVGLGYDAFIARGSGMDEGITDCFPESDLEMMKVTIDQYINAQPFNIYYMSVSGHSVYSWDLHMVASKNRDVVEDLPYSETVKCYLAANMELEYAMEYLISRLEEAGIADDTVIVMGTDHYPYGLENSSTWGNNKDYMAELYGEPCYTGFVRDRSSLIIWSGCLEDKDIVVDTPVMSLDILPTLSNLFGVEYDSRLLVGRDVFSDQQSLVLWPDFSWKTEMGTYQSATGQFTPAEGVQVDEGYIAAMTDYVRNKITYSRAVAQSDYFNYLAQILRQMAEGAA